MSEPRPLKVLIVEDDENDVLLLQRALRRSGYEPSCRRVDTAEDMRNALASGSWQVILADFAMPKFSAFGALEVLKESKIDIPFIVISGVMGEERAVDAIKAGAHDYLIKGQLERLGATIARELREVDRRAEQEEMRRQLLLADRVGAIGTLAAGIAHEINSPLAALLLHIRHIEDVLKEIDNDMAVPGINWSQNRHTNRVIAHLSGQLDEIRETLNEAHEAGTRVHHIVKDLKGFTRGDEGQLGPIDLRDIIERSISLVANEIRHRARLAKDYGEIPFVQGNDAHLSQVVVNLLINAVHALPEGRAEKHVITISTSCSGSNSVVLEVSDTGCGIAEEDRERVFEPFFTTKPVGIGTGLGLWTCHRIVTGLGGEISIHSRPGGGTKVRVRLPSAQAQAAEHEKPAEDDQRAAFGRILIIDDDRSLCRALTRMLSTYEVKVTSSPHEGLEYLLHTDGPGFDAILCDLMMPEMSGKDLYERLEREAPALAERVIFITGGAFTGHTRLFARKMRHRILEKPFNFKRFHTLLKTVMNGDDNDDDDDSPDAIATAESAHSDNTRFASAQQRFR